MSTERLSLPSAILLSSFTPGGAHFAAKTALHWRHHIDDNITYDQCFWQTCKRMLAMSCHLEKGSRKKFHSSAWNYQSFLRWPQQRMHEVLLMLVSSR